MGQYEFLIPDRYVREVHGEVDMNTASIFWGFSLGVAVFSVAKVSEQSWRAWKSRRRVTSYVAMVWAVWFCYLLKLQIEMKMAELITKIVRSSGATGKDNSHQSSAHHARSMATNTITKPSATHSHPGVHGTIPGNNTTHIEAGDRDSSMEIEIQERMSMSQSGIVRTVETAVTTSPAQIHDYHRSDSITSSTAGLAF
ncbi:uncharacterized protein Y057_7198 [Fusarium fujikuroi]|nr:uncharacterized protein Y057_7198 [Fusarium fujikuroi]